MDKHTFILLADRYRDGSASDAEKRLVDAYCERLEQQPREELSPEEASSLEMLMYARIMRSIHQKSAPRRLYWWYAAAAAVVLAAGAAFFLLRPSAVPAGHLAREERFKNDLDPGVDKATLTLADGSVIALGNESHETIARQGGAAVLQTAAGVLEYQSFGATEKPVYNTLSTPAGGQFRLTLPDGSKVWLNAGSSLRFPTVFTGLERMVELKGEAYLEVSKDAARPFRVIAKGMTVDVLGTHFNINAYDNEPSIRTTLLEGAVRVGKDGQSRILAPGDQSSLMPDGQIRVASGVDMGAVTAWKDGKFSFHEAPITEVMRQVERWYGAEVVYEGEVTHHFVGTLPRNLPVSRLLEMLEMTGRVKFMIEGNKIIVKP
ncbi:FecR domain-containing protein [Chitinophaga pollutisoli]|uniref:FecR domain-containing protein n=1 Tax=Chitinophaga pollutisoli TaxID=3133966 RepID=A0ABZ2YUF5_9BACT